MLEWTLSLFYLLILAIAGIIFLGYFWQWFYYKPTAEDQTIYFRADDGWRLALHHYGATKRTVGLPVILCHGLSANHCIFEIPGAPSLADFLKRHGRDVWVPDLRGSGMSDRPRLMHSDVPYSWGFDDHLRHDVPAIINRVMENTGSSGVHWVGHSMGGLLILAHAASHPAPNLASIIAMGSPTDFSKMDTEIFGPLLRLKPLFEKLPVSPLPFFGRLIAPLAPWIPASAWGLFHQKNIRTLGHTQSNRACLYTTILRQIVAGFWPIPEHWSFWARNGRAIFRKPARIQCPDFSDWWIARPHGATSGGERGVQMCECWIRD